LIDDMRMGFDFSRVPGGYGWVFPKADHVNVGLYTQRAGIYLSRRDLSEYVAERFGDAVVTGVSGYPLGMGGWRYRPGRGRCLLVGDAAGMVDPLLGEGLYHAIVTGQRAAAAIWQALNTGDDACRRYTDLLLPIRRELLFTQAASAIFYRLPGAGHALLTSPMASGPLMKGFSRGLTLLTTFCHAYRSWFGVNLPECSQPHIL
jgi:flavin-dependent dehydrogenase